MNSQFGFFKMYWSTVVIVVVATVVLAGVYVIFGHAPSGTSDSVKLQKNLPESSQMKNITIVKKIVEDYYLSHTYSKPDMFVCGDMASDVWNMVITKGLNAKIQLGNVDRDISSILDSNHVWVLAEVSPNGWVALECTAGYLVCPFPNVCPVNNSLYYSGWGFNTPKEFKDYMEKLNHPCPDGSVLGSDEQCHISCGINTYCTGESICIDGECRGCKEGYAIGSDYKCYLK